MKSFLQWSNAHSFYLQGAIVAIEWILCHRRAHWLAQAVGKALLPWLIGMSIVLALLLIVIWLPSSQDPSLKWLEGKAISLEWHLEKLSPYPFLQSLGFLIV